MPPCCSRDVESTAAPAGARAVAEVRLLFAWVSPESQPTRQQVCCCWAGCSTTTFFSRAFSPVVGARVLIRFGVIVCQMGKAFYETEIIMSFQSLLVCFCWSEVVVVRRIHPADDVFAT